MNLNDFEIGLSYSGDILYWVIYDKIADRGVKNPFDTIKLMMFGEKYNEHSYYSHIIFTEELKERIEKQIAVILLQN